MRRAILLGAFLAVLFAGPAAGTAAPAFISLAVADREASYGELVVATGSIDPAISGEEVVFELRGGDAWSQVARATTDAAGSFAVAFVAMRGGSLVARALGNGAASEAVELSVSPRVEARAVRPVPFARTVLTASIAPATYAGRVTFTVKRRGQVVTRAYARASSGRAEAAIVGLPVGRFALVVALSDDEGLAGTFTAARLAVHGRTLSAGSAGAHVRGLARRLAALRFHVPGESASFSHELTDSVIAFQKAFELPRTGIVGPETWRMLERAAVPRPRYRNPSPHIEVDKTRQILLVVQDGDVTAVLPVSSGATGNTPEGKHVIRWKAPATTTWLGSGILYRTMTFVGNSFAIHGWVDVPPYPASHGCVRIPIWTADWLYQQSPVGETVYVY
jgi:lipoprotein-anchoring transpeptidase ErfK/SrfK